MTVTDDDRLWRDQNIPNMTDDELGKIIDTFGQNVESINDIDNMDRYNNKEQRNNKDKDKDKKDTKKIPIKKYSQNGKGSLYESVVIGEKSTFAYLDKDKKPQFIDEIPRVNDTLISNDTIDTQNPIPFVIDSKEDLEQCLEDAKLMDLDFLFSKIESINRLYVDVEPHYHVLFIASMIWTWLQDRFGITHYNIIVGDNGSGKNSQLLVFKYLGYRVFYVVSASAPNYYTKMGNIEEGQITIAEDAAEDIAINREKRNVFKSGYCSGATVPKVELEGGRKSEDWLTYCQKWVAMEELPIHNEIKGILDRSFVFKFLIGNPQYNIKDVIKSVGDPKFKPLFDELIITRKILFCWRLLHYNDVILDVDLNVKNRTAELTKPLIRLFQNSPIALQKILDSLSKFMIERNEIRKNSFESKLYEVIDTLKQETDNGELTFTNKQLLDKTIEIMDCKETEKPNIFWSLEVGCNVTQTKITSITKSKFKAKPFSKKIEDKTVRCLEFEQKYLDRIKSIYDIPDKIEIKQKVTPVTLVTLVTLYTGIQVRLRNNMHTEITPKDKNLFENFDIIDQKPREFPIDGSVKEPHIPPRSVTSVTSVTDTENQENNKGTK